VNSNIPLSIYIRINRLKLVGHVRKMEVYCMSKEILGGGFGGRGSVGIPRSRWEDKVQKDAVSLLHIQNRKSVAPNRIGGRKMRGP
jgi:hypothetical protein